MPLGFDPDETFPIVLDSDRQKTDPPAFLCRFLTAREWARTRRDYLAALEAGKADEEKGLDALYAICDRCISGVRGMAMTAGEAIRRLIGRELWELSALILRQSDLTEDERKNSGSPSSSSTTAAGSATAASAPATA